MTRADQILQFYRALSLPEEILPEQVRVMNPYAGTKPEIWQVICAFYEKYYGDQRPRQILLGINPGRHGAGVTGIPFTDSVQLEKHCALPAPVETREVSASFVYEVIQAYGGPKAFYADWFIGAPSPLGFVRQNAKGNWVNYNYYDSAALTNSLEDFMLLQLTRQQEICGHPRQAVVLGTGKNYRFLQKLNQNHQLWDSLHPLEHPRYIMQYKLRQKAHYVQKFTALMQKIARQSR